MSPRDSLVFRGQISYKTPFRVRKITKTMRLPVDFCCFVKFKRKSPFLMRKNGEFSCGIEIVFLHLFLWIRKRDGRVQLKRFIAIRF